jgi:geranylgeranyl pyrophosphate synthase
VAYDSAYTAAYTAARNAAYTAARNAALGAARDAAWDAARNAVLAFIAYDDAANYLAMPSDQLKAWAILSENPAAILLLPVVIAYERISEWELA